MLSAAMAGEGVAPPLKVLYVPDYVPLEQRVAAHARLVVKLGYVLPSYTVQLAYAEGPFEDDEGIGAHFTYSSRQISYSLR